MDLGNRERKWRGGKREGEKEEGGGETRVRGAGRVRRWMPTLLSLFTAVSLSLSPSDSDYGNRRHGGHALAAPVLLRCRCHPVLTSAPPSLIRRADQDRGRIVESTPPPNSLRSFPPACSIARRLGLGPGPRPRLGPQAEAGRRAPGRRAPGPQSAEGCVELGGGCCRQYSSGDGHGAAGARAAMAASTERERQSEREGGRERERKKEKETARVCVNG